MAPTEKTVELQTSLIIQFLFEDEEDIKSRQCLDASIEVDSPAGNDGDFDPVLIADKLRSIGDALNEDAKVRAALNELKKAVAEEAVELAFGDAVDALCQNQVAQGAEVAPEIQLIKASVNFGLYITKSSPELKNKVRNAMTAFLNRRVSKWVTKQGGWDKVNVED